MKQAPRIGRAIERAVEQREPTLPRDKVGTVRPDERGVITRTIREMFRARDWELDVPGVHPGSGLEYDVLLDIFKEHGRDFRAETPALNRFVLAELQTRFEELGRTPTVREFNEAMGLAVLAWIVKRFAGTVRDVKLHRLTRAYAARKRRLGYGNRPIGTATGSLAHRVAEFGRVNIRKAS